MGLYVGCGFIGTVAPNQSLVDAVSKQFVLCENAWHMSNFRGRHHETTHYKINE